jgi:hypothetical protein
LRPAEAAAVNAMASGSQHITIIKISHRIARSESVSAPTRLGNIPDRRGFRLHLSPPGGQRCAFGLQGSQGTGCLVSLASERRAGFLLPHRRDGSLGPTAPGRLLDRRIDLAQWLSRWVKRGRAAMLERPAAIILM